MSLTKKEKEFLKKLGKRIVFIRDDKGISQKELSDILDMDDGSLRRIESGRTNPTTVTLLKVSEALEIELAELFKFQ